MTAASRSVFFRRSVFPTSSIQPRSLSPAWTAFCVLARAFGIGARERSLRIVRRRAPGFGSSETAVVCCLLKAVFGSGFGNLAVPVGSLCDFGRFCGNGLILCAFCMLFSRRCVGVFRSWGSSDVGFDPTGDSAFLPAVRGVIHSRRFAENGPSPSSSKRSGGCGTTRAPSRLASGILGILRFSVVVSKSFFGMFGELRGCLSPVFGCVGVSWPEGVAGEAIVPPRVSSRRHGES